MTRKWLAIYLAHWYSLTVAGLLMALQSPSARWLDELPWGSWGTEIAMTLGDGDPLSGGAAWIALGAALVVIGAGWSLWAAIAWIASSASPQTKPAEPPRREPALAGPLSARGAEAAELVEDPQLRQLIHQLNARLG